MRAQLMPMTAAGDSFSKYAAVLFFMGACISWRAPGGELRPCKHYVWFDTSAARFSMSSPIQGESAELPRCQAC